VHESGAQQHLEEVEAALHRRSVAAAQPRALTSPHRQQGRRSAMQLRWAPKSTARRAHEEQAFHLRNQLRIRNARRTSQHQSQLMVGNDARHATHAVLAACTSHLRFAPRAATFQSTRRGSATSTWWRAACARWAPSPSLLAASAAAPHGEGQTPISRTRGFDLGHARVRRCTSSNKRLFEAVGRRLRVKSESRNVRNGQVKSLPASHFGTDLQF
jgi:hypothetical protein